MTFFQVCSAALALIIGIVPMVPAAHVHESTHDSEHHAVVAHQHIGPHNRHSRHSSPGAHHASEGAAEPSATSHHDGPADAERARNVRVGLVYRTHPQHFDDDDSVVATVDSSFVPPLVYSQTSPSTSPESIVADVDARLNGAPAPYIERVIHGPPRGPTPLRGPPSHTHL